MKSLEFVPMVGIGPIKLGMTRNEVRSSMLEHFGETVSYEPEWGDAFISNGFHTDYTNEICTTIRVFNLHNDGYHFFHSGTNLFDLTSFQLVSYFRKLDSSDRSILTELDMYLFPKIGVAAYNPQKQYDKIGGRKRKVFHWLAVLDNNSLNELYRRLEEHKNKGTT